MWSQNTKACLGERRRELQFKRLKATVERVYNKVGFYRAKMEKAGITPADLRSLDDLKYLPFTTKEDLRLNYPFGLFAAELDEVSSDSCFLRNDREDDGGGLHQKRSWGLGEVMARSIASTGGGRHDRIQIAYGYGLFTRRAGGPITGRSWSGRWSYLLPEEIPNGSYK